MFSENLLNCYNSLMVSILKYCDRIFIVDSVINLNIENHEIIESLIPFEENEVMIYLSFNYFDYYFDLTLMYKQFQIDLYKNKKLIESYIREDFWTPENHAKVFAKDLYLIMNKYNIPLQVPKKVSYFKFKRTTNNIFEILWTKLKYFFSLNSIEDELNIYNKYFNLESWCIEFNHDLKIPCREIGLDKFNKPILLLPKHNEKLSNYNIYSYEIFKQKFDVLDLTKEEFEKYWNIN